MDSLLTYYRVLIVLASYKGYYLYTELINKAYSTIITTYPSKTKTYKLL